MKNHSTLVVKTRANIPMSTRKKNRNTQLINSIYHPLVLCFCFLLISQQIWAIDSQNEIANTFSSGSFNVAKVKEQRNKIITVEITKRPWPVTIKKTAGKVSEVLIKRAGVIDETYTPDVPGFPAYFKMESTRITFLNGVLIYYTWKMNNATIRYILAPDATTLGKISTENLVTELETYVKGVFKNQTNARSEVAEDRAAVAAAEKATYSLKGKDVKKLKLQFIDIPSSVGHFSKIYIGATATLADGSTLSTKKLGGQTTWEDFDITCEGCDLGDNWIMIKKDAKEIPNDLIKVTIKSKYHDVSTSQKLPVDFNTPLTVNYNGQDGCGAGLYAASGGGGGNGRSLMVYAQPIIHKHTGVPLYKVSVQDIAGKVLHRFKVQPGIKVQINAIGGNGCKGRSDRKGQGSKGGSGGRGGNVTLYKDGDCNGLSISIRNNGGRGGQGGDGSSSYNRGPKGREGTRGTSSEQNSSFKLDF